MAMLTHIVGQIDGCIGAADLRAGRYRLDFDDGKSREATAEEVRAAATAHVREAIKAEARRRILAVMPEWKQANATARMLEKLSLGETADAEWQQGQSAWNWIKSVRAHSDELEAQAAFAEDPLSIDITAGWPE